MKLLMTLKNLLPIYTYLITANELTIHTLLTNLEFSMFCLKNHINFQYKLLSCISGIDLLINKYRYSVAYELLSITFNARIRVKICVNEISPLTSIVHIFVNANWWEREIWDLYGLYFKNHPDLRRILTDYGFEGHPMRKDFPLSGYIELKYDINRKQVVHELIELSQNFRYYNYETPW